MEPLKFIHHNTNSSVTFTDLVTMQYFKPKSLNLTSDHRLSTHTISADVANARLQSSSPNRRPSTIPLFSPCIDKTKYRSNDNDKNHEGFWKLLRPYLTFFSRRKSKPKNTEASRRNGSNESVRYSPVHDSCYSAMNSEDRKEHLKEVISYCKNSWGQVILFLLIVFDCTSHETFFSLVFLFVYPG